MMVLSGMLISLALVSSNQASRSFAVCPPSMTEEECAAATKFLSEKSALSVRPDFLVPDSPAFSVLGITPETVIRPESPRDFAVSVLNGMDPQGHLQSGVAIDTAPYVLGGVDLADYRRDPFERFLSRTQLSLATAKGSSDDDSSMRASVGLRFTLFDQGDPRMDQNLDAAFYRAVRAARVQEDVQLIGLSDKLETLKEELDNAQKAGKEARVKELQNAIEAVDDEREELERLTEKDLQKAWTAVLKEYERGQWNATSAALGIAPVFFSEEGSYNDMEAEGYTFYGTFSYGFDQLGKLPAENGAGRWLSKNANLLLHARHTTNEKKALDGGSVFREQDTTVLGMQVRLRGPSIWSGPMGGDLAFGLETDYVLEDFEGGDDEVVRVTGIVELKPFKNSGFTLKVAVGGEGGGEQDDNGFVVMTINWALD